MKKKVLIVFGTRPEAIKLVPIIQILKKDGFFDTKICVSGQHRDMLDDVMQTFDIVADFDLSIMKNDQTLSYVTQAVTAGLDKVLDEFTPDIVLVHGDTSTAFAAALTCFYKNIPIAHVEAGLRSHDIHSPYPEEFNRRAIALISSIHFAPTDLAFQNLKREGISESKIHVVGNTVIDTLAANDGYVSSFELSKKSFALITVHRRENSEKELCNIFTAIKDACESEPDFCMVYPMHKSPRVRAIAEKILGNIKNVTLCEPLNVKEFHAVLKKCRFVLTDSGGIQEEAAYLGKPVIVLRDNTERPEAALCGTSCIVGSHSEKIKRAISSLINDENEYTKMARRCFEFGDGHASERIIEILRNIK